MSETGELEVGDLALRDDDIVLVTHFKSSTQKTQKIVVWILTGDGQVECVWTASLRCLSDGGSER